MLHRAVLSAVLSVALAACGTTAQSSRAQVDIAPQVVLRLPQRQPFGNAANAIQLVQAAYKTRTEIFQAIITTKGDDLSLVMTVPNGPRIMSFDWHGETLNSKFEPIAPKGLSAEHMLADIIAIYAPPEALRSALEGGTLAIKPDGTREISRDGEPVIRISFPGGKDGNVWEGRAVLENLAFGYRLDITSHPLNP